MSPPFPALTTTALLLAQSIEEQTSDLVARQFQSPTPVLLAHVIRDIASTLAKKTREITDEKTLKLISRFLKELGTHLRYIEAAASLRIPSGLISPMEKLVDKLYPTTSMMLRTQWSYNYYTFEILKHYREALANVLTEEELSKALSRGPQSVYIVSFPAIEYPNVLQHTLLGHEFGHLYADSLLNNENAKSVLESITSRIGDGSWYDREITKRPPFEGLTIRVELLSQIHGIRSLGLAEIICDIFGYYLFGPAFVFSTQEFSFHETLDSKPREENQYYPPWRFRIRELMRIMDREGALDGLTLPQGWAPSEQIRTALETRVESLRQIARDTGDAAVINNDGLLKRAYEEIAAAIPGVESSVVQKLEGLVYSKDSLAQELPELLALLSIGVPPNRTALKVAGLRSVINAGWIYRIARLPIPYRADKSWGVEDDITLNRLILKAIEYIDVQEEYDQWKREKKTKG